jgi:hypothetical protein
MLSSVQTNISRMNWFVTTTNGFPANISTQVEVLYHCVHLDRRQ